mmetsp:Transcript_3480/g.7853  ORF Transcript_3480/g.7853 Transcript_3480/m.7853 type:complete len:218 (+) Transcript_3480:471-1124(+)
MDRLPFEAGNSVHQSAWLVMLWQAAAVRHSPMTSDTRRRRQAPTRRRRQDPPMTSSAKRCIEEDSDASKVVRTVAVDFLALAARFFVEIEDVLLPLDGFVDGRRPCQDGHGFLEGPQVPHAIACEAQDRLLGALHQVGDAQRPHVGFPRHAVALMIKIANRASHVQHHLRVGAILWREDHGGAVAPLRLEAEPLVVGRLLVRLVDLPTPTAVGAEDC